MQTTAKILGKQLLIECSDAARKEMEKRDSPLLVEMELYFSCLIRKAVRFNQAAGLRNAVQVTPQLTVGFRPICTKVCRAEDFDKEPPVEDFAILKPEAFVPKQLNIDFRKGQWWGEFQMNQDSV